MDFKKKIWYLFKLNRRDFNKASDQIEKVLMEIFEAGKIEGQKEQKKIDLIKLKN